MYLKVKKSELRNVSEELDNNAVYLLSKINEMEKIVESMKSTYSDYASDYIFSLFYAYLQKLKTIPYTYDILNQFIGNACNIYEGEDTKFKKMIQSEALIYEKSNESDTYK